MREPGHKGQFRRGQRVSGAPIVAQSAAQKGPPMLFCCPAPALVALVLDLEGDRLVSKLTELRTDLLDLTRAA